MSRLLYSYMAGIALTAYLNKDNLKHAYESMVASTDQEMQRIMRNPEEVNKYLNDKTETKVLYGLKTLLYSIVKEKIYPNTYHLSPML